MVALTWSGAGDVTHTLLDTTPQTETSGVTMVRLTRVRDNFGETLEPHWTKAQETDGMTITESGGLLTMTGTPIGSPSPQIKLDGFDDYNLDDPLDLRIGTSGAVIPVGAVGAAFGLQFLNRAGPSEGLAVFIRNISGTFKVIARSFDGGVATDHAETAITLADIRRLRFTMDGSASQLVSWFYDDDGTFTLLAGPVDLSALAGTDARAVPFMSAIGGAGTQTIEFNDYKDEAGKVYWKNIETELVNKTFPSSDIELSTLAILNQVGVAKLDHSTDGGSTYTGTFRTIAQVNALPDIIGVTQLRVKPQFNGGLEVAAAGFDSLTVNRIPKTTTVEGLSFSFSASEGGKIALPEKGIVVAGEAGGNIRGG